MKYALTKAGDIPSKDKFGIHLDVYPDFGSSGLVVVSTETGHNQEFYDLKSTFNYIVLEGQGTFFLDDEEIAVSKGDLLSVPPKTRIYYKGKMKLILVTDPAWQAENEVETKKSIW